MEKKVNKIKPHDRYKRDLTTFQEQSFLEDININENLSGTDNKFNELKKQSKPWMNKYILKLISHREILFSKDKKDPTDERAKHNYKLFRNRITREIKKRLNRITTNNIFWKT